jgi:hypothetical protein
MLLRVLGPVEAEDAGGAPLDLGGPRQRKTLGPLADDLLALALLADGRPR